MFDKVYHKAWRAANPDKVKNSALKRDYGITLKLKQMMMKAQENKCAICKTDVPGRGKDWCVDHNHSTGKVRGLLCNACNNLLGLADDNEEILLSAVNYLRALN